MEVDRPSTHNRVAELGTPSAHHFVGKSVRFGSHTEGISLGLLPDDS